jgi:flavin reductase (DIM6/NTAB) family NADH-FMN oxidoreductase RutF
MNDGITPRDLDPGSLRRCLGSFVTGVTIVTTIGKDGAPQGFTANSFTSVSLDPPLVLVCLAKNAKCFGDFMAAESFAINILSDDQRDTSNRFAKKGDNKFEGVDWKEGITGSPQLSDSLATLDCAVHDRHDAGDHVILLGEVKALNAMPRQPLVYAQGSYVTLGGSQDLIGTSPTLSKTVGCIALFRDRLLLMRTPGTQTWGLPTVRLDGSGGAGTINDRFRKIGLDVELSFLFSVFDLPNSGDYLIFRGTLLSDPSDAPGMQLFAQDDVPWDNLDETSGAAMLRRFFREAALNQFGIYAAVEGVGSVARIEENPESFGSYYDSLLTGSGRKKP